MYTDIANRIGCVHMLCCSFREDGASIASVPGTVIGTLYTKENIISMPNFVNLIIISPEFKIVHSFKENNLSDL